MIVRPAPVEREPEHAPVEGLGAVKVADEDREVMNAESRHADGISTRVARSCLTSFVGQ
jgi:hypothetical protein